MKKVFLFMLGLILPLMAFADAWETEYKRIEQSVMEPTFPATVYPVTKYGAKPGAKAAANQKAINKAIAACSKKGGGTVLVAGGTFETGAIRLESNVNLRIEKGAQLNFVFEPALYPVVLTRWEGVDCYNISPCIYAYKANNIAITGEGTVDGGGSNETWWKWCGAPHFGWQQGTPSQRESRPLLLKYNADEVDVKDRRFTAADCLRPQLVHFLECEKVLIENLTFLRSPFWVLHPTLCKSVTVRGVHVINDGPNGDGCDPESCDGVIIEDSFFNTGDDCIAVKSGRNNDGRRWNKPTENIIIRNCRMENGHGGVVIGSEITGGCRNLFAENCEMDSPLLDRVIRIKTNTCRGGLIENIYVRNINVGECKEAVLKINLDYDPKEVCCRGFLPIVRNINLENVKSNKSKYGVMIVALDSVSNVYDINLKNCEFKNVQSGDYYTGRVRNLNYTHMNLFGVTPERKKK